MAELTYIGDYEDDALGKALSRHRSKPRISAVIRAMAAATQQAEDALIGVSSDALFQNATGDALDLYGLVIGESRSGLLDGPYRTVIAARALANQSQGTTDELIDILLVLAGDDNAEARHLNLYPASAQFTVITDDPPDSQYLARVGTIMRLAKPAGVSIGGVWAVRIYFGFAADPDAQGYNRGQLAFGF